MNARRAEEIQPHCRVTSGPVPRAPENGCFFFWVPENGGFFSLGALKRLDEYQASSKVFRLEGGRDFKWRNEGVYVVLVHYATHTNWWSHDWAHLANPVYI